MQDLLQHCETKGLTRLKWAKTSISIAFYKKTTAFVPKFMCFYLSLDNNIELRKGLAHQKVFRCATSEVSYVSAIVVECHFTCTNDSFVSPAQLSKKQIDIYTPWCNLIFRRF